MNIWAHRGCSQNYPENTMLSFEKAVELDKLTGIELDIQLTKDGELIVCHDERVDRTTDGIGFVRDYTLAHIKRLKIDAGTYPFQRIPTMEEILDLLQPYLKQGMQLNIELKNSVYPYEGMEEKIINLVHKRGLQDSIVYSTFYAKSLEIIKQLDSNAKLAILDFKVSDCLYKLKGGCGATALHPFWHGMDLSAEILNKYTVRAWMSGHLFPEKPTGSKLDLGLLEKSGITDIIMNEPERYVS